ncbi:MAG TPA: GAF domain-containing protein, partial [Burkholderiales bacterium]|nr:GAF domain-containing protein [Burkholderiales bacterium]
MSVVWLYDGALLHYAASHNFTPEVLERIRATYPKRPDRSIAAGRAILDRSVSHIPDMLADSAYAHELAMAGNWRASAAVPMLRDGKPVGAISIGKAEAAPFTPRQIQLLCTFADQAVIAIENARLFEEVQARTKEATEALEYQTAIAEVLSVISKSPNELKPVLDAITQVASRLCDSEFAALFNVIGDRCHIAAANNANASFIQYLKHSPVPVEPGSMVGGAAFGRKTLHIEDVLRLPNYTRSESQKVGGQRTVLSVPLLRDGQAVGVIALMRSRVEGFTEKQINLVETFADQAVIAIENARLFEEVQARTKELTESLEYQTATSEVLSVISRSPDQLQPVLDVITETAVRLCRATHGHVRLLREDGAYHVAAHQIPDAELLQLMRENPFRPGTDSVTGRVALQGVTVHVADVSADPLIGGFQRRISDKIKTAMGVPLKQGGRVVGIISVWHTQVQPFTQRQIKLVETFADQAVIAINNVGLFEEVQSRTRELQESLEYQTATSDVLAVISKSPDSVHPVFEAIITMAERLCGADFGFVYRLHDDNRYHLVAAPRASEAYRNYRSSHPVVPGDESIMGRALRERAAIHVADVKNDRQQVEIEAHRLGNIRSALAVPLMNAGRAIGVMGVVRSTPNPFSQRQVELVETFADQAVIAIENARLFEEVQSRTRELQESLEYQTATSDVLQVISSSPGHLQPIYQTMLAKALRHCDAKFGGLFRYEGGAFRGVAGIGVPEGLLIGIDEGANSLAANSDLKSLVASRQTMHSADLRQNASYLAGDPFIVGAVERGGARAALLVPLVKDDDLIGALAIYRREARPFSDKQIQLVQTFADQAVIAIENTRLFEEVQVRTRELAKTVEDLEIASQHKSQFVANMS